MRPNVFFGVLLASLLPVAAGAADFNPQSADDLQNALNTAAINNDDDQINLAGMTYSTTANTVINGPTFFYSSTEDHNLTIVGLGAGSVLDGGGQNRVLDIEHSGTGNITLQNFVIQNGNSQGNDRAGLRLDKQNGDVLVENCQFLNNRATALGEVIGGAGILANPGSVTLRGSVFRGNRADDSEGALDLLATSYMVTDNLFEDNRTLNGSTGAADIGSNGPSVISGNIFINNHSENSSFGAVDAGANATLDFSNNLFQGNTAMGNFGVGRIVARGIHANANTFLDNESLTGNVGAAAFFFGNSDDGTFTNNIVAGNQAAGDTGGVQLQPSGITADLVNNTFYGNSAGGNGGGVTLINEFDSSVTNFYNNIAFANQATGSGDDIFFDDTLGPSSVANIFNNLFGEFCQSDPAGCDVTALGANQGNNIVGQNPLLVDPENDNFYPGPGSPALEKADPSAPNFPAQDHDGNTRPTGILPDIGALEAIGMISVDPLSHDFGSIDLGNAGQVVVTLTNLGGVPLDVTGMSLNDAVNFELDLNGGPTPCGSETPTLEPGASCTVVVIFQPQQDGAFAAVLTIGSADPQLPSLQVALAGAGVAPANLIPNLRGGGCLLAAGTVPSGMAWHYLLFLSLSLGFYLRRSRRNRA